MGLTASLQRRRSQQGRDHRGVPVILHLLNISLLLLIFLFPYTGIGEARPMAALWGGKMAIQDVQWVHARPQARYGSDYPPPSREEKEIARLSHGRIPPDAARFFTKGNRVTPLTNTAKMLKEMKKEILSAHTLVQMAFFNFSRDDVADTLIEAKKERPDLQIQLLLDPKYPNSDEERRKRELVEKLEKNGVEVQFYPVYRKRKQIYHLKLLLVDGKRAMVGSFNLGTTSHEDAQDMEMIDGPAVNGLEEEFREDWLFSRGKGFPAPPPAEEHPDGTSLVSVVSTAPERKKYSYAASVYRAVESAKKSIHMETFVLTDGKLLEKLIEAKERGADVKIILDSKKYEDGNLPSYGPAQKLKEAGIEVKWADLDSQPWKDNDEGKKRARSRSAKPEGGDQKQLHRKLMTVDEEEVIDGSGNFTYKGFHVNRELGVDIVDSEVASHFESNFKGHWKIASEAYPGTPPENVSERESLYLV